MHFWRYFPFVYAIPAITIVGLIYFSNDYKILKIVMVSLGAGSIGTVLSLLTVAEVAFAWGGKEESGRPTNKAFFTAWALSILLGIIISFFPHIWGFPGWVNTAFLWLGGLIVGIGLSFLIAFALDILNKLKKRT